MTKNKKCYTEAIQRSVKQEDSHLLHYQMLLTYLTAPGEPCWIVWTVPWIRSTYSAYTSICGTQLRVDSPYAWSVTNKHRISKNIRTFDAGNRWGTRTKPTSMQVHLAKSLSLASTRSLCRLVMQPWSIRQIRQRSVMFGGSCLSDIVSRKAVAATGPGKWTRSTALNGDPALDVSRRVPALRHQ